MAVVSANIHSLIWVVLTLRCFKPILWWVPNLPPVGNHRKQANPDQPLTLSIIEVKNMALARSFPYLSTDSRVLISLKLQSALIHPPRMLLCGESAGQAVSSTPAEQIRLWENDETQKPKWVQNSPNQSRTRGY